MKIKSLFICVAILSLLASAVLGQESDAAKNAPKLVIKETTHNLGEVKRGSNGQHTFVFKNEGTTNLEIKRVAPTCGCTASDFTKIVPPGQEGKITLAVNTNGFSGAIAKTAEVYTNDPQKARFTLMLDMVVATDETPQGKIVGPFLVGPTDKWSGRAPRGMSANGLIFINSKTGQPVRISKVTPGGEAFTVALQTLQEGTHYSLNFTSAPGLPLGNHRQLVKLTTDSAEQPELTLTLEVNVIPALTFSPASLTFDKVPVSNPESDITFLSKFVWLRLGRGAGLEVKAMTSDLPFIKAQVDSTGADGQSVIVRVGFNAKPTKGTHSGKLKIETNNTDVKVIEVPINVVAQ